MNRPQTMDTLCQQTDFEARQVLGVRQSSGALAGRRARRQGTGVQQVVAQRVGKRQRAAAVQDASATMASSLRFMVPMRVQTFLGVRALHEPNVAADVSPSSSVLEAN